MGRLLHSSGIEPPYKWYAMPTNVFDNLFAGRAGTAKGVYSQDTNVHPAFGVVPKIERNTRLVNSVFKQRAGVMLIGDRTQETLSDPLHRPPKYVLQQFRQNSGGLGIDRALIRPAAPGQVTWKNSYWRVQRPPYRSPIGPFTQGQLEQQSIIYRISQFVRGGG
jgi:hypothetical protein